MKTIAALLATLMSITVGHTAENSAVYLWHTDFRSKYLGKTGQVFYDNPIMVNDVSVSYGDFYAGLWVSTALGGESYGSTFGDEFDLYAGWGHTYGWVRFQLSAAYFAIKDLDRLKDDIWIVEPEVSFPEFPLIQPYVAVRSFGQVSSESPEDGWFVWPGVRRTQPLGFRVGTDEAKLNLDFVTAYSDGAFGKDPGWVFARLSASFPIQISRQLAFTPNVVYQIPFSSQEKHRFPYTTRDEAVANVSFRWMF